MCSVHIQGNCQGTAKVFQLDYKSQDIMILLQMALSHSKSLLQGWSFLMLFMRFSFFVWLLSAKYLETPHRNWSWIPQMPTPWLTKRSFHSQALSSHLTTSDPHLENGRKSFPFPTAVRESTNPSHLSLRLVQSTPLKGKGTQYFPDALNPPRAKTKSHTFVFADQGRGQAAPTPAQRCVCWVVTSYHLNISARQGARTKEQEGCPQPPWSCQQTKSCWCMAFRWKFWSKHRSDLGWIYARSFHPGASTFLSVGPLMQSQMHSQLFRQTSKQLFGSPVCDSCCKHCGAERTPPWASGTHHVPAARHQFYWSLSKSKTLCPVQAMVNSNKPTSFWQLSLDALVLEMQNTT